MPTYLYLPVPTPELTKFADTLRASTSQELANRTLRNPYVSGRLKGIHRFFTGCLSGVKPTDELLLIAHGGANGSRKVGQDGTKAYAPDVLARAIEKEGLTKSFRDLKLVVCGSGLGPKADPDRSLESALPFGERLCAELKARNYNQIEVTGYKGEVFVDKGIEVSRKGGEKDGEQKGIVGFFPGADDDSKIVFR